MAGKKHHPDQDKRRVQIIQALAEFRSSVDIAPEFDLSESTITGYADRYRREIEAVRQQWLKQIAKEPLANKRVRIRELQALYKSTQALLMDANTDSAKLRATKQLESILNSARVEVEGNKITFSGIMTHSLSDNDLIERAADVMRITGADVVYSIDDKSNNNNEL